MNFDYKKSGVDTDLADRFVDRLKFLVQKTYDERTYAAVGGFAALYKMDEERFLASSTDGVGTKLKLAIDLGIHDSIGIDLVAMCVNDLICTGARPLFFLDYFATGKLDLDVSLKVIEGIVEGCKNSSMALIGGETAEMPGLYQERDYDLAGFCVGEVFKNDLIDGSEICAGDTLIGIASSGFHSNGYSLIRSILNEEKDELIKKKMKESCLTPTKIYVETVKNLRKHLGKSIRGISHITGSGLLNIPRMNESFDYEIHTMPALYDLPIGMQMVMERSFMDQKKLSHIFNMGIGLVIATNRPVDAIDLLRKSGEKVWIIGKIHSGNGELIL